MNIHLFSAETTRKAVAAFLAAEWQPRLNSFTLDELKIAVILVLAQSANRSCTREIIPHRIQKLLRILVLEQEMQGFAEKIDAVVNVLMKQGIVARYRSSVTRVKLVFEFEQPLLRLLVGVQNRDAAGGGQNLTGGQPLMAGTLREVDDPTQLRAKTIAHVSIFPDTSYHFKQQLELIFTDKSYFRTLIDREPPRRKEEFNALFRKLRDQATGGKPNADWRDLEYGLRLRGIDLG